MEKDKSFSNSNVLTGILCAFGGAAAVVGGKLIYDELRSEKNPQKNQHQILNKTEKHSTNNQPNRGKNSSNNFGNNWTNNCNPGINYCQSLVACQKCGIELETNELSRHLDFHENANNQSTCKIVNKEMNAVTGLISHDESSKKNKANKAGQSKKSTFICFKCGKEVPYTQMKDHNSKNCQEKLSHNTKNMKEHTTKKNENKNQSDLINENIIENKIERKKQKSSLICNICGEEVEYYNLKNHNYEHKKNKPIYDKPNEELSEEKLEKLHSQPQKISKSKNFQNLNSNEDESKKIKTIPKCSTVKCNKCGEEIAYNDLKEHNYLHKERNKHADAPAAEKVSSKQKENSKPIFSSSNKCENLLQTSKNVISDSNQKYTNSNEIPNYNQDLINNIMSLVTTKTNSSATINIQFSINNSNQNDNTFLKADGFKSSLISENNFKSILTKIQALEEDLCKYDKEYKKLQNFIKIKINSNEFKISDINSESQRLSELEDLMKETNCQINKLKESNISNYNNNNESNITKNKSTKISDASIKKIEELDMQIKELNSRKDDSAVDKLHILERQLHKLKLEQVIKSNCDFNFSVPSYWNQQSQNLELFKLKQNTKEFKELSEAFLLKIPNSQIKKIKRVQNLELWKNFCFSKNLMTKNGQINTKFLFYGTINKNPASIYESSEEGFDMKLATPGLLGNAIYFTESPRVIHPHSFPTGSSTYILIIAEVLIGETLCLTEIRSFKYPPFRNTKKNIRYDSVKYENDLIYAVYNNMRAYPSYLIEYSY